MPRPLLLPAPFALLALTACSSAPPPPPAPSPSATQAPAVAPPAAPRTGRPTVVPQTPYPSPSSVEVLALSPDNRLLATGASWGRARIWDTATGALRVRMESVSEVGIYGVYFGPGARTLAGVSFGAIYLWDAATGALLRKLAVKPGEIDAVAATADGSRLIVGTETSIEIIDLATGETKRTIAAPRGKIRSLSITPDAARIAVAHADRTVTLFDGTTGEPGPALDLPADPNRTSSITGIALSPDGHTLIVARNEHPNAALYAFALDDGGRRRDLPNRYVFATAAHHRPIGWAPDSSAFALARDEDVLWVDAKSWATKTFKTKGAYRAIFAGGNDTVVACGQPTTILDVAAGAPRGAEPAGSDRAPCAASSDGRLLALGSGDTSLLIDLASGARLREAGGDKAAEEIDTIAWGAAGATLTTVDLFGRRARLWESASGVRETSIGDAFRATLRPDGLERAAERKDGTVTIVDLRTGAERAPFPKAASSGLIGWSPDGKQVVLSEGNALVLRDPTSGAALATLPASRAPVSWSPSGALLVSTVGAATKIWHVEKRKTAAFLKNLNTSESWDLDVRLRFSPDESVLVAWPSIDLPALWDLKSGARIATFEAWFPKGAFLPGTNDFVTGAPEGLAIFDGRTGRKRETIAHEGGCEGQPIVHPGGALAISCKDGVFVRGAPGEPLRALQSAPFASALAFSADGAAIAGKTRIAGNEGRVVAWSVRTGERVITIDDRENVVKDLAWSPSAPVLLVSSRHGLYLARTSDGEVLRLRTFHGEKQRMTWIAYSRHGLFTGDREAAARVFVRLGDDPLTSPLVPLDQLDAELRRPSLLADFLALEPLARPVAIPLP